MSTPYFSKVGYCLTEREGQQIAERLKIAGYEAFFNTSYQAYRTAIQIKAPCGSYFPVPTCCHDFDLEAEVENCIRAYPEGVEQLARAAKRREEAAFWDEIAAQHIDNPAA